MTSTRRGLRARDPAEEVRVNAYWVAAVWMAMALLASLVSIRVGISVALIEIVVGAVAGNIPGSQHLVVQTEFTTFLATLGSAVLTFLAGAEIDPVSLRRHWRVSLGIGVVSFIAPFVGALLFSRLLPTAPAMTRFCSSARSWPGQRNPKSSSCSSSWTGKAGQTASRPAMRIC